jgi:hypothetical protein
VTASDRINGDRAARDELRRAGATVVDQDPVDAARRLAELDGLSALRAIMAGDIPPPPIGVLLGFEPVEVEEGRVVFAVEPGDRHSRGLRPLTASGLTP